MKWRIPQIAGLFLAAATALPGADFIINYVDNPGVGFNDATPVPPSPGNPEATLGGQRKVVLIRALQIYSAKLKSDVPIVVQAVFINGACTPTSAVLASAGPIQIFANFPNTVLQNTWYHSALANKLAGQDLTPGGLDPGYLEAPFNDDVIIQINVNLDADPACLGGGGWYYGLDHNEGAGVDLLATLQHEIAHGLGFSTFVNDGNGEEFADLVPGSPCETGCGDVYETFLYDSLQKKFWRGMTDQQRMLSAVSDPFLTWSGKITTLVGNLFLDSLGELRVVIPSAIAAPYRMQVAEFGSASADTLDGAVVLANDGLGTTSDACEGPFTGEGAWTNAAAIAGRVALVDRGSCSFVQKVLNAQQSGAAGVVIANNLPGLVLPPMGDDGNGGLVTVPAGGITMAAGDLIKSALPIVVVNGSAEGAQKAGMYSGRVRVHAPNPNEPGSSISHWTPEASPNLLMEPAINSDLTNSLDLTLSVFAEQGWALNATPSQAVTASQVESAYGACDGSRNYDAAVDVDQSGCVDAADLRVLFSR